MRILLTANASYVPPRGGATRSNLAWLEQLASHGHSCRVVAPGLPPSVTDQQVRDERIEDEWIHAPAGEGIERFERGGITVFAVAERTRLVAVLREQIREFEPDWVLVSSEDLGHVLLREAARSAADRLVYLAHTPQFYPFGSASWNPDSGATEIVRRAAGVVAIGKYAAAYITEHTGREVEIIHPPIYGGGPFPNLASFGDGLITMINPCAVKGICIFLALADRFPDLAFGALPGWGTTEEDRRNLERRPNIRLLPNCHDLHDFLRLTRVLLMPSLWLEGFGLSVLEAKLCGIPAISSDSGGLLDGNVGTGLIVPVHGIERFEPSFDEHGMPRPVLPENDIEPWAERLAALTSDAKLYRETSELSRAAALKFVESVRPERMEQYLAGLGRVLPETIERRRPESLSPERRALLLRRLRDRARTAGPDLS